MTTDELKRIKQLAGINESSQINYTPVDTNVYHAIAKAMKPSVMNALKDKGNVDCYATPNPPKITVLCGNKKLYITLENGNTPEGNGRCTYWSLERTGIWNGVTQSNKTTVDFTSSTLAELANMLVDKLVVTIF